MRIVATAAILTFAASQLFAAERPATPDFSRPTLLQIFSGGNAPRSSDPFKAEAGQVTLKTHSTNVKIGYLPFLTPLPGSYPTTTRQMINPFEMLHTEIPQTARTWASGREANRELRRIERLEREEKEKEERARVTVKTQ